MKHGHDSQILWLEFINHLVENMSHLAKEQESPGCWTVCLDIWFVNPLVRVYWNWFVSFWVFRNLQNERCFVWRCRWALFVAIKPSIYTISWGSWGHNGRCCCSIVELRNSPKTWRLRRWWIRQSETMMLYSRIDQKYCCDHSGDGKTS